MAIAKTILHLEVNNQQFHLSYTGGLKHQWDQLSPSDRKRVLRHDGRIMDALSAIYDQDRAIYEHIAGFFRAVDRFKRREAKKDSNKKQTVLKPYANRT